MCEAPPQALKIPNEVDRVPTLKELVVTLLSLLYLGAHPTWQSKLCHLSTPPHRCNPPSVLSVLLPPSPRGTFPSILSFQLPSLLILCPSFHSLGEPPSLLFPTLFSPASASPFEAPHYSRIPPSPPLLGNHSFDPSKPCQQPTLGLPHYSSPPPDTHVL